LIGLFRPRPRGQAALDAAIANYPDQRFTLRNGVQVISAQAWCTCRSGDSIFKRLPVPLSDSQYPHVLAM
jgi:hypothetical protein